MNVPKEIVQAANSGLYSIAMQQTAEAIAKWQREKDAEICNFKQERDELAAQVEVLEDALRSARGFIVNGVELGYIRMPDASTPDPAHNTLDKIYSALSITPSAAPREIEARTLEEAANAVEMKSLETYGVVLVEHTETAGWIRLQAVDKRKGE